MNPHREPREAIAAGVTPREREGVAWRRAEERTHWERLQRRRGKKLGDLERRSRREWVELGKAHFEEVRAIEPGAGEAYRGGMEGSEEWAEVAARTGGWGVHIHYGPPVDHWKLRSSAEQVRLEQVREIYGEQAYEERKRAWERASQPLVPLAVPVAR